MKRSLAAFAILVSLAAASCVSLPPAGQGRGMLLIKTTRSEKDSMDTFVSYRLYYDSSRYFLFNPRSEFTLVKNIVPGTYSVKKIQAEYNNSDSLGTPWDADLEISIEADSVTVLDRLFTVEMVDFGDGRKAQRVGWRSAGPADAAAAKAWFESREGAAGWTVKLGGRP